MRITRSPGDGACSGEHDGLLDRPSVDGTLVVAVVNWNSGPLLSRCLASLRANPPRTARLAVVVVDNCSSDDSIARARAADPLARFMLLGQNLGFAAGSNLAIAQYRGAPFVLLLNPDAEVSAGALDRLLDELRAGPMVGAVGPRIVSHDGTLQRTCARAEPSLWGLLVEASGLGLLQRKISSPKPKAYAQSRDVDCISGACMLISGAALLVLGGLDATIPMYFEDLDICHRLREHGWGVRFVADAEVRHVGAACSERSDRRTDLLVMEKGDAQWLFFRRHRGATHAALAVTIIAFGAAIRLLTEVPREAWRRLRRGTARRRGMVPAAHWALLKWAVSSKPRHTGL